jgi:SulP family sulfate permease
MSDALRALRTGVSDAATKVRSIKIDGKKLRKDAVAGLVLGVESVPDGLSFGVLAGVNPLAGLYGYLYGTVGGALFSSTSAMAVQVTGAMAIIVADTDLSGHPDPERTLFTLAVLTGALMVVAGIVKAGKLLRFVPRAVMVGFISGVGVNTVLGQLGNFTGYDASGSNRVFRTVNLFLNLGSVDLPSVTVGILTLVLIVWLERTRLAGLGLVIAVIVGSTLAYVFGQWGQQIKAVGDVTQMPDGLPFVTMPVFREMPSLIVPAVALAFVGLVQGAGVSAAFPNADGRPSNTSRDFIGQGAGSILSGLFQGMPAGGSMSATALVVAAGAKTRMSLFIAGGVMAVVVVAFSDLVAYTSFPALAALLIVVGWSTVRPHQFLSVVKTGPVQATVVIATFVLTVIIPVPQAVLAGVAIAVVLHVIQQSNKVVIRQLNLDAQGHIRESDPPVTVPPGDVVLLQPYGSLFFASSTGLAHQLPQVDSQTDRSVVVLRLRGIDDLGMSVANVVAKYGADLRAARSRLLISGNNALLKQLASNGTLIRIGPENFYLGNEWHGRTLARAAADGWAWIAEQTKREQEPDAETGGPDGADVADVADEADVADVPGESDGPGGSERPNGTGAAPPDGQRP